MQTGNANNRGRGHDDLPVGQCYNCCAMSTPLSTNLLPSWEITTASPAETETLGRRLGSLLRAGDIVSLYGDLGAGKTCLTRGLAAGWGASEAATSPTFTLVNEYHRGDGTYFYHADCYRLDSAADAISAGLTDLLDTRDGVLVIEWSDRIAGLLPPERLDITLRDTGGDSRILVFTPAGARAESLVAALFG